MIFYPYINPIILTDAIFTQYTDGLLTGSALKQTAYWLAEEAISRDLNTFLLPTIVTGTYHYTPYILLDHAYIHQVFVVRFLDNLNQIYYTASGSFNNYTRLYSDTYGVVDLDYVRSSCWTCSGDTYPYQVQIVYQAGLFSGTSYRPNVLLALSTLAGMFINEIQGYGNEGEGGVGIIRWSNQEYSETRMGLINTTYGSNPKAQFIHRLLDGLRKRRHVGI